MKKLKLSLSSWLLGILVFLSLGVGLLVMPKAMDSKESYAATEESSEIPWLYTDEDIPYTLCTQSTKTDNNVSSIVYRRYENSGEYILLTSDSTTASESELYNSSIYVKFNQKREGTYTGVKVPNAGLTCNAWLNGRQITIGAISTDPNNAYVNYAISFRETSVITYADTLEPVDPTDRSGLYQFKFIYRYADPDGNVSEEQKELNISFHLIDKTDYISDSSAYNIEGAVTAPSFTDGKGKTHESYVYNYRYDADGNIVYPTVSYEANKFALNYEHTVGTSVYNYKYYSFVPNYLISDIEKEDFDATQATGRIAIIKSGTSQIKYYPTYKNVITKTETNDDGNEVQVEVIRPYYTTVDMSDLGEYKFYVDLIVPEELGSSVSYQVATIPDLENSEVKYLSNFGYEITYKDQKSNTYKLLRNNFTHADMIAKTPSTDGVVNATLPYHIPANIPVTDQAPIKFNYYSSAFDKTNSFYSTYSNKADAIAKLNQLSAMTYENLLADRSLTTTFYETSKFDKKGIYVIKVCYSITTSYGQTHNGAQVFCFEINNDAPALVVEYDTNGEQNFEPLTTQYTNKNIRFKVHNDENAFNAPITIRYTRYAAFNDVATSSGNYVSSILDGNYYAYTLSGSNYSIPNSLNGRYVIVVTYSPSKLNQYYQYIVDTSDIGEITFTKVTYEEPAGGSEPYFSATPGNTIAQTKTAEGNYDLALTNSYFTLSWKEKPWAKYVPSGITTNVTAYQLLLKNTGADGEYFANYDRTLTNGYKTDTAAPLNYQNSYNSLFVNNANGIKLSSNEYQTANGIYYFYVEDLAGNKFERLIMIDTSNPVFIQESQVDDGVGGLRYEKSYDPIANPANFVRTNTRLTFGKNKGIEYDYQTGTENMIFNTKLATTSLFKEFEGHYFINIPINNVTVEKDNNGIRSTTVLTNPDVFAVVELTTSGSGQFAGEGQYYFTSYASNGGSVYMGIEMNFDGAMGQYYMSGDATGNNDLHYIANNNGSNLYKLIFKFKQGTEKTEVVRLTYSYYKFDYFSNTATYPFSTEPEKTDDLRIPENIDENKDASGFLTTDFINVENGKTAPGKYVLTRYYYGGGYTLVNGNPEPADYGEYDASGNKVDFGQDSFSRKYTIYVDHNGIISTTEQSGMREVGDNISITIGKGTPNQYTFKNFFRNVSSGLPILTTNKLPVQINIPVSKYFIDNGSANTNVLSRLYFTTLDVVVTYKDTTKAYSPTVTYRITNSTNEGYYVIPTFTAEGTYTISISDRTGYNDGSTRNINPMTYSCSFIIRHTYPNGDVYLNDELLEPSELDDKTFATNANKDQSVTFKWQDAQDPYTASVVEINITAKDRAEKDTLVLSDYNIEDILNGTFIFDYTNFVYIKKFSVELLSEDVFEGKIYHQYRYTIELNIDEELDYNIEIRYAESSVENHGYGQYVSTSYRIKIDRTKPNLNIDDLLAKDNYLVTNGYYRDYEDLKENFKEENAIYNSTTPTIYDYAFAVDTSSYKLAFDGEDTISTFYFRKYAKFENENQSITPDHKDYSNLSNFSGFPRFNITQSNADYFLASYNTNATLASIIMSTSGISEEQLMGKFYEIIEKDLAGNYRVFTVYFNSTANLVNILQVAATRNDGGNTAIVDTQAQEVTTIQDLTIGKVNATVGWGKLVIKNITDASKVQLSYTLTPYLSTSNIYNMGNEISNYLVSTKNCRISFSLTTAAGITTKFFNIVKSETKLPMPNILETENGKYVLVFPQKTSDSVIYLTGLVVKNGNTAIINTQYPNIPTESQELEGGVYKITYTDNTDTSYTYQITLGIDYVPTDKQFTYATNSSYTDSDGVIYTGGDIFVTFQSEAHTLIVNSLNANGESESVTISKSSYEGDFDYVDIEGVNYISIGTGNNIYLRAIDVNVKDNGFRVIRLKETNIIDDSASETIGGTMKYTVDYKYKGFESDPNSVSDSVNTYNFVIYNELAGINLFDKNQNPIVGSTSSTSMALTSSSVKITWNDLATAPLANLYNVTVLLNSLTESGETISSIEITKNRIISTPGYYAVTLCNTAFGNFRSVYFAIQDGEVPFFTVVDTKTGATLVASPEKLDIVNNLTKDQSIAIKDSIQRNYINSIQDTEKKALLENKLAACPDTIDQYFSLNDCDLRLDASSDLYSEKIYFKDGAYVTDLSSVAKNNYITTFYLIYGDNNPIYANLIAVTKVPKSETNIVSSKLYYVYKTNAEVANALEGVAKTIKNTELDSNSVHIFWPRVSKDNNEWYNRGNLVYLNYTFNNVTSVKNYGQVGTSNIISADGGLSTITISGSGKHQLTFMDLAGNVSFFKTANSGYSQSYYQVTILDKVIYTVNNTTPLDYAVYNSDITLSIDTSYSSDYNINSLTITVMRNGQYYENYIKNSDGTSFTFTESGRYIVTLNANYQDASPLNNAVYNFTRIEKTSARLAYEFNEMLGYTITKVYKNNSDITDRVKAYYIAAKNLNVAVEDYTLSELYISPERFGNGDYIVNVAVKYNTLLAAKEFSFGFRVSDVVPVIMSSPEYGGTTKKEIVLTFNPSYIYQQIGKSAIVIYTFNADTNRFNEVDRYVIDESSFTDDNIKTFKINQTNSYYFQLVTDSGNIITSFRINRAEPLNTLSIIIIVLASVTVVVLIIVFIKMRTKMKVR